MLSKRLGDVFKPALRLHWLNVELGDQRQPEYEGTHAPSGFCEVRGWDAAVAGTLYGSVYKVKTHANMGNLFGWIYGDMSKEFREATWAGYVESLEG